MLDGCAIASSSNLSYCTFQILIGKSVWLFVSNVMPFCAYTGLLNLTKIGTRASGRG